MRTNNTPWTVIVLCLIFFFPLGAWLAINKVTESRYDDNVLGDLGKPGPSWTLIFICMLVFFPVGIWLLITKLSRDRGDYEDTGKKIRLAGIILAVYGAFMVLNAWSWSSRLFWLVIPGGGAVVLYMLGNKYVNRGRKYKRYRNIVDITKETSIDKIAAAYPTSYEQAVTDLQEMIDRDYFYKAFLDLQKRQLIFPAFRAGKRVVVDCPNCGAKNTIVEGSVGECTYCKTML